MAARPRARSPSPTPRPRAATAGSSCRAGKLSIVDLGSRNGTLVNGERHRGRAPARAGRPGGGGRHRLRGDPPLAAEVAEGPQASPTRASPPRSMLPIAGAEGVLLQCRRAALQRVEPGRGAAPGGRGALPRPRRRRGERADAHRRARCSRARSSARARWRCPRPLVRAALDERSVARLGAGAAAPLALRGGDARACSSRERKDEPLPARGALAAGPAGAGWPRWPSPRCASRTGGRGRGHAGGPEPRLPPARWSWRARWPSAISPACFVGERGTGKRMLARFSIARGPRALQPLVVVDCRSPQAERAALRRPHARQRVRARRRRHAAAARPRRRCPARSRRGCWTASSAATRPAPTAAEIRFDVRLYTTARGAARAAGRARRDCRSSWPTCCARRGGGGAAAARAPGRFAAAARALRHRARGARGRQAACASAPRRHAAGRLRLPGQRPRGANLVERLALLDVDEVQPQHLPPETRGAGRGRGGDPGGAGGGGGARGHRRGRWRRATARRWRPRGCWGSAGPPWTRSSPSTAWAPPASAAPATWPRIVFSHAATLTPLPSASPIRLPTTESDFSMPMPGPYATISISTFARTQIGLQVARVVERQVPFAGVVVADLHDDAVGGRCRRLAQCR